MKEVKITVNLHEDGGIFKEYMHNGVKYVEKLGKIPLTFEYMLYSYIRMLIYTYIHTIKHTGKIAGLNSQDDIVFIDGDTLTRDGVEDRRFGILQILCGFTEHIADYHVHSGYDNRVTIHTPDACPLEMDTPYICDYKGIWEGHDEDAGGDYQCKCDGDVEMCKCLAEGPEYAWCQQWFDINAFMNEHPQDGDDDHEDDHEDDHVEHLPEDVPAVALNEVAKNSGKKIAKFSELDADTKKKTEKFLFKKLQEQQKLQKRTRGNRGKK